MCILYDFRKFSISCPQYRAYIMGSESVTRAAPISTRYSTPSSEKGLLSTLAIREGIRNYQYAYPTPYGLARHVPHI